jgi:hypothetical protein
VQATPTFQVALDPVGISTLAGKFPPKTMSIGMFVTWPEVPPDGGGNVFIGPTCVPVELMSE